MVERKKELLKCATCSRPVYLYGKKIKDKWYHRHHIPIETESSTELSGKGENNLEVRK